MHARHAKNISGVATRLFPNVCYVQGMATHFNLLPVPIHLIRRVRLHRDCDYAGRKNENDLKARIAELESLVAQYIGSQSSPSTTRSENSSTPFNPEPNVENCLNFQRSFIDGELRQRYQPQAPMTELVSPTVMSFIGTPADRDLIISSYFDSIHTWMPIISKSRLRRLTASECLAVPSADFSLLLLAMQIIQDVPQSTLDAVKKPQYTAFKSLSAAMESAGVYTVTKLQAEIIVTVYEAGHGIFPAAYMSLGRCITQGTALGIHNKKAPSLFELPRTWAALEEMQRVWWMVLILERLVTSFQFRIFLFTRVLTRCISQNYWRCKRLQASVYRRPKR